MKELIELGGFDADAGVFDFEADGELIVPGCRCLKDADADLAFFGEFDGIANQIDENLAEPVGVDEDAGGNVLFDVAMQEDAGFEGSGDEYFEDVLYAGT